MRNLGFDTARIGPLHEILEKLSPLQGVLHSIVRFRVVVDANYVVQTLIYMARYPERGATVIEELVKATVVDVFAPKWLEAELTSAIPQAAATSHISEDQLWGRWNLLRPFLKWDNTYKESDHNVVGCCDPKDLPYIMLERKLGADGILSKDRHIAKLGGHLLTLDFMLSARKYARASVTVISIKVLGTVLPAAAMVVALDLARRIVKAFATLPDVVKAALVLGGIFALAHPDSRKWIMDRSTEAGDLIGAAWHEIMQLVKTLSTASTEAQHEAALHLGDAMKAVRPKKSTRAIARRVHRRRSQMKPATGSILVVTGSVPK